LLKTNNHCCFSSIKVRVETFLHTGSLNKFIEDLPIGNLGWFLFPFNWAFFTADPVSNGQMKVKLKFQSNDSQ
jgi:hypothetical protein